MYVYIYTYIYDCVYKLCLIFFGLELSCANINQKFTPNIPYMPLGMRD